MICFNFLNNVRAWIISKRDNFNHWLLSDGFPLKISIALFISMVFDSLLTSQILFNDKEIFLQLEQNKFLVYSYQNNLWWLFGVWNTVAYLFMIWICTLSNNKNKKAFRIMVMGIVVYQLSQPLLFILLK